MAFRSVLLSMVVSALAVGCGADTSAPITTNSKPAEKQKPKAPPKPKADVSQKQIKRYAAGSPERVVLEWWRDVQLNDPQHARDFYVDPPTLPNLAGQFNFVEGRLDGEVDVGVEEEGAEEAVVRVRWGQPGDSRSALLYLGESGGGWKLLDTRFLDEMVARMQRAESAG